MNLIQLLQNKTNLPINIIENIIKLLDEGCTIPLLVRYRKEFTNGARIVSLEYLKKFLNIQKINSKKKMR